MTKKANLIVYPNEGVKSRLTYFAYARSNEDLKVSAYGNTQRLSLAAKKTNYYDDLHPKCNGQTYSHEGKLLMAQRIVDYNANISLMPLELFT